MTDAQRLMTPFVSVMATAILVVACGSLTDDTEQTLPLDNRPTDDAEVALETIEFSTGRLLREHSLPWSWSSGEWVHESNRTILFIAWHLTDVDRWSEMGLQDETAFASRPLAVLSESLVRAGLTAEDFDVAILVLNDPIGTAIEAHAADLLAYAESRMSIDELLVRVSFTVDS